MIKTTVKTQLKLQEDKTTNSTDWSELTFHLFAVNKGEDADYFFIGSVEYEVDNKNASAFVRVLIDGQQHAIDVFKFPVANIPHTFTFFGLTHLELGTYIISLEGHTETGSVTLTVKNAKLMVVKF